MNLVSLTFVQCGSLQQAVDKSFQQLLAVIEHFEKNAEEILSKPGSFGIFTNEIRIVVEGMRHIWVGNLYWQ